MSKADQSAAKSQANKQISENNANQDSANSTLQSILGEARGTASGLLPGVTAGYSDIASTGGGVNQTADTTFTNLATTGGITPDQEASIRNRNTAAATSAYKTASDQASRTAAATGGYGNSGAVLSSLARQGSNAASTASENTEATIAGMKQAGMESGAQSLAAQQQNITSNKLQGLAGNTNIYGMNETQINATVDNILKNYQSTGQLNNQDLSILTNLANQPGVFDKIVGTVGTLGGAAAGVIKAVK